MSDTVELIKELPKKTPGINRKILVGVILGVVAAGSVAAYFRLNPKQVPVEEPVLSEETTEAA